MRALVWIAALALGAYVFGACTLRVTDRPGYLGLATEKRGVSLRDASNVVIVLHGYGGDRDDLASVAEETEALGAPARTAFVFAEAPYLAPPGRAWWRVDGVEHAESARRVSELVDTILADTGLSPDRVFLAGFSQGAMLALEVALQRRDTLGGVVAFAPCRDRIPWASLAASHAPLRVTFAHGRLDHVCSPGASQTIARELTNAGHDAKVVSFEGPHRVSREGEEALAALLKERDGAL